MTLRLDQVLAASVVVCVASMVKGGIGFGFPLLAVPLLSTIMGPRVAIPVIAIPTLLSNVLVVRRGGAGRAAGVVWMALAGLAAGTVAGALLLGSLDPGRLSALVGAVAVLYVLATALHLTLRIPTTGVRLAGPVFGVAAGLLGGSTGISSPLLASYLHLLRLEKREFVFWLTMMFFVVNICQVVVYARLGLYSGPVLAIALWACAPMAIGTLAGLALQDRLDPRVFERIVLAVVFAASLNLLARSL
ncbi:MAG TPA: sulfite exporter TauE/SafE family protein [bacterium]|nr:sulfite exporter TauE/SafE family protein [bacterium]